MPFDFFGHFYPKLISQYHINKEHTDAQLREHLTRFGDTYQSRKDFIWSMMQAISLYIAKKNQSEQVMYRELQTIYSSMMQFLCFERRPWGHILKLFLYAQMKCAENEDVEMAAIVIGLSNCPEAEKHDGLRMPLSEAMRLQLIPFRDCKKELGCGCCYAYLAVRDLNGIAVTRKK